MMFTGETDAEVQAKTDAKMEYRRELQQQVSVFGAHGQYQKTYDTR